MNTRLLKIDRSADCGAQLREAAACLAAGGLVVFPTETVYGVGANAANPDAVARLRAVKQRADTKPFTLHIGSRSAVERFVPGLSGLGRRLAQKAWPGPLTLVFNVPDIEAAPIVREISVDRARNLYHNGTIGIRCPDDRVAAELLMEVPTPVVAASANPGGQADPVDADECLQTLSGQVDLVLDAGRTRYARPSTIVRVDEKGYQLLREGVLDERTIRRLAHVTFLLVCSGNTCRSPMAAGLLRRLLAEKLGCPETELEARGYTVESAGTSAFAGASPSPAAVRALEARGIDISGHRARTLTSDLISRADYIFAMTASHATMVASLGPNAGTLVRTIDQEDIDDPVGGGDEVYRQCADRIEKALRSRLKEIAL
ncbi:MAG: L-threonylcarbamoyladenylate synthase [Phycisphaerae bacterium]